MDTSFSIVTASYTLNRTWDDTSLLYPGQFHDPVQVEEEIENILQLAPEIVDVFSIGQSYLGRNLTCLRITNEENQGQKAKALVVAHHHGREQITVEMALRFILRLVNGYGEDSKITKYVNTEEIYIIPTLNPDALDRVINEGDYWLRKNLRPYDNDNDGEFDEDPPEDVDGDGWISEFDVYRKESGDYQTYLYSYYEGIDNDGDGAVNEDEIGLVDLNRNYNASWGSSGSSGWPSDQTYRGPRPFSEPETQAMRDFALQHKFAMAYSLHSGINATYLPSDRGVYLEPDLYESVLEDYDALLPSSFGTNYGYSLVDEVDDARLLDSALFGKWADWMYMERATTLPVCFEIFRDGDVTLDSAYTEYLNNDTHVIKEWEGIYGYFNPPASKIDELWEGLRSSFDYLLGMIPRLDIDVTPLAFYEGHDHELRLSVSIRNLSPRLGTVDDIEILAQNGTTLATIPEVEGDATTNTHSTLVFSTIESIYTVFIGNNYSGYQKINIIPSNRTITLPPPTDLSTTTTTSSTPSPTQLGTEVVMIATGLGGVVVIVLIAYIFRRRR
ncbi:MAG: M14 family zinc carboxypeptidase [Candidatus Thorarchaeota archaeon]